MSQPTKCPSAVRRSSALLAALGLLALVVLGAWHGPVRDHGRRVEIAHGDEAAPCASTHLHRGCAPDHHCLFCQLPEPLSTTATASASLASEARMVRFRAAGPRPFRQQPSCADCSPRGPPLA